MWIARPQQRLFLASLGTGVVCLLLLDLVFVPAGYAPDESPRDAAAEARRPAVPPPPDPPSPSPTVVIPAAARVPTIVARFDSQAKEPADEDAIRTLARAMIEDHGSAIVLEGHSDTYGGDDYNHEISLARAVWVKNRLVELGVSTDRIETVGLGATRPLHSDSDAQASVNRRVEVRWK